MSKKAAHKEVKAQVQEQPRPEGYKAISTERWEQAQKAEISAHDNDSNNTAEHYAETYKKYFSYVGLGTSLDGLHIIEIGPAHHSALAICTNYGRSVVVEPMLSEQLLEFTRDKGIIYIDQPVETITTEQLKGLAEALPGTKEVWLFNVMQHIIDPDLFVEKCKAIADRIRFFEPIDYPVSEHHPHTYTIQDFGKWFGQLSTHVYQGGNVPGFHESDCAYGVWIK